MVEEFVGVPTADGTMKTFIARPDGDGPFPAVIMYMARAGLIEELLDLARRFADNGYYCAVPDLYYRVGRSIVFDPDVKDPFALQTNIAVSDSIKIPGRVIGDTDSLLEYLDADPTVSKGPMGTIGYCMGGRYAPYTAAMHPERFKATVSLFGTAMLSADQFHDAVPHIADKLQGEIYFGLAELDHRTPPEFAQELSDLLAAKCTAKWEVEILKDADHGFVFKGRPVYNEAATERSWDVTFAMFDRQLRNQ